MPADTRTLFGTSGIRGPAETLFTPQFCFDIGRAFAFFLDQHQQTGRVAVGIDSRASSPHISQYLVSGLTHAGREVIHLGCIPVPAANHVLITTPTIASVMITGSHIDITSNGVKFFAFKEEIDKTHEAEITEYYYQIKDQVPAVSYPSAVTYDQRGLNNYIESLIALADGPYPKWRLVFDPGNGGQTEAIRTVLRELGIEFLSENDNIQEPLISRDTESDGAFASLQESVHYHHADFGVGFDTDGDRVVFVDRHGQFVPGDYSGSILAKWNASDVIVTPVNVSNAVNHIGKEVIRTKVGSPYVIAGMKKFGANFGFEGNGGCIHEDVMFSRDGGTSLIKMLNVLKWSKRTLDELVSEFPKLYLRRTKFNCPTEKFPQILQKAKTFLPSTSIDETDGVKLNLDTHTWLLFRPSGNAPEFRIFVESTSATKVDQLIKHAEEFAINLSHV